VSKLARADLMYQYSLTWFLQLFHTALEDFRGHPDRDQEARESDAERSGDGEQVVGIDELTEYFRYQIYSNVCRSLFEKDKLLFSFMLAITLAQARGDVTSAEYASLVEVEDALKENSRGPKNQWSDWLAAPRWNTLCHLASRSPSLSAVVDNFAANAG